VAGRESADLRLVQRAVSRARRLEPGGRGRLDLDGEARERPRGGRRRASASSRPSNRWARQRSQSSRRSSRSRRTATGRPYPGGPAKRAKRSGHPGAGQGATIRHHPHLPGSASGRRRCASIRERQLRKTLAHDSSPRRADPPVSSVPSPSKSPAAMERGAPPGSDIQGRLEGAIAAAQKHGNARRDDDRQIRGYRPPPRRKVPRRCPAGPRRCPARRIPTAPETRARGATTL